MFARAPDGIHGHAREDVHRLIARSANFVRLSRGCGRCWGKFLAEDFELRGLGVRVDDLGLRRGCDLLGFGVGGLLAFLGGFRLD
jgi:hypothetical protein